MLDKASLMAFVATSQPERAKKFYRDTLGLRLVADDSYALVFDSGGTMLRIQKVEKVSRAPYTALGWEVENIAAEIDRLAPRGVVFEKFGFFPQDERGVWTAEDGTKVAWFKDPDENLLGITEFTE